MDMLYTERLSLKVIIAAFMLLFKPGMVIADPADTQSNISRAVTAISRLQAIIEYYYMETGIYPASLQELNAALNSRVPRGAKPVKLPVDPATSRPFTYVVAPNRRSYALRFPDPTKYGGFNVTLKPVAWGWMATLARRRQIEAAAIQSKIMIEHIATQCEMYAKDHQGRFPSSLDDLYPKYIKRYPQSPLTGKNYIYKQTVSGYIISDPNPESYGLKEFSYSSREGMRVIPLSTDKKPSHPNRKQAPSSQNNK